MNILVTLSYQIIIVWVFIDQFKNIEVIKEEKSNVFGRSGAKKISL